MEPVPEALQQATVNPSVKENFTDKICSTVQKANLHCPAHAHIARSKTLILDLNKPMLHAANSTVQRAGTLQLYAEQIEALYASE
ncbi:hypothetical protein PMG11_02046 [Penicillium brasilianum]|uniref:Uncharacterized protein n=1 Tax=Penicillium brasilianum TaxID=104259 RepID=A0A0F7TIR2_PENBI|nr:hypothetical protein PMG11_02046 [Penicillium brasilianum]